MYSSKEKSASRTRGLCLTTAILAAGLTSGAMAASNLALNVVDAKIGSNDTQKVVVRIAVDGDVVNAVGAQFIISYDTTKLSLDATADGYYSFNGSALDLELYEDLDTSTGIYRLAIGADGIDNGEDPAANVQVSGNIVTLTFTPLAEFCEEVGLVTFVTSDPNFESMLSDNQGAVALSDTGATNLGEVSYDITAPAFVSVPSNQSYWADAEGAATTTVSLTSPTATDGCDADDDGAPTVSYSRSDSANNLNEWPRGSVTTVTWSATDDCGNTNTVSRTVDVSANSLAVVSAAQGGSFTASSFDRGLRLEMSGSTSTITAPMTKTGSNGSSRAESLDNVVEISGSVSSGCARVSDPLHTLRRAISTSVSSTAGSHGSRNYNSRYIVDASDSSDWLRVGNANQDTKIDILDFGTFAGQRGSQVVLNTGSGSSGPHCDFNASSDGIAAGSAADVTNADLSFLSVNFFTVDETCGSYTGDAPIARISVKELRRSGQGHLAAGDINGDGWLDTTDMALMLQGQTGQPVRTGNSSSGSVAW